MFENVNVLIPLALAIGPILLAVLEYFVKKGKALFLALNAVYFAAACLFLISKEATIASALILASVSLCARLFLEILEGGKSK